MRTRFLALLAAMALVAVAPACSSADDSAAPTIRLASIASATGSASTYGVNAQRGVKLAVELLGEGRIELRTWDDQSTNDGGTSAMRSAIAWEASAVLMPTLSPVALAASPLGSSAGVPMLGVSNATIDLAAAGDWFWRVSKSESQMVAASVDAVAERGENAVLIWEPADGYSVGSRQAFLDAAAASGITITRELAYVDGSTSATSLAATAAASSPDLLFMALRSAVAADFLTATSGSSARRVGGNGFNSMPVITKAGVASEGLIVSGSWNLDEPIPMSGAFVDRYLTVYGSLPDSFAAQGYAAVQAVLAAARRGGGTAPADIQRGLGRLGRVTNPAPTVLGEFGYTLEREPTYPAVVQQVRAGELVPYR